MEIIDKNKLNNLLDKKLSKNDIEELSKEIIKKVKELKKREKNKKRKEQLDLLEKKFDLKILNKNQISKIPNIGSGIAINDRIMRASKSL